MTQPLTVIILNDYCHINGGASRVAIDEAAGLAEQGIKVIFLGACSPVCTALEHDGIQVVCLGQAELAGAKTNPAVLLQGLWNAKAHRAMQNILRNCDAAATVVHLHGYTKALSASPVRAAVDKGFKVICTLHDFFTACPNGAFFNYPERKPCPLTALSAQCISSDCDKRNYGHKLYRVSRSFVQRGPGRLPKGVSDYISLSRRSEEILRPYLPSGARLHRLENPIDAVHEPPVDVASNDSVVAVGRLDVEKGVELLLEAAAHCRAKLLFIGDGPLRPQAEAAGHRVTGWLPPDQVTEHLRTARCLVFASLWYETYGLVVAESAALGIPAIVSDISAAAERVTHGRDGWVFHAGDAAALSRCLENARDDVILAAMGNAAYERFWSSPPTRENHIAGLLKIYDQVLAHV